MHRDFDEFDYFTSTGKINFPDEVDLGIALAQVYQRSLPKIAKIALPKVDKVMIRSIIENNGKGFLSVGEVSKLLIASGLPQVVEYQASTLKNTMSFASKVGFPLVMKVLGPVHKTDVGGVVVNVRNESEVKKKFQDLIKIKNAHGVLLQPMLSGIELFIGAKKEAEFGHLVLFGLGGVFVEIFKDVGAVLSPCGENEIYRQLIQLKGYKLLEGYRGKKGINIELFIEYVLRVMALIEAAPEIQELDINPLFAKDSEIKAVDVRIRL